MPKVLLSLGSNIPPKKSLIQQAISEIVKRDIGRILMISPYYKTDPVGEVKQDWFVNNCILIDTNLKPLKLLEALQQIENDYGRVRKERWGARTIDIDIILFELSKEDQEKFKNHPDLKIPHPEMLNRAFVLHPMFDLMPWLVFDGKPLADHIIELGDGTVRLLTTKSDLYEDVIDMYWDVKPRDITMGLERIQYCAELMDNPQLKLPPIIHIAGTNGKGSTAAILHNLLASMGKKVHRYTSPHILSYCERFVIGLENGGKRFVEIAEFEIAVSRVAPLVEKCKLSHFEALTMVAFLLFSENPADYVILETGMGGRLDATNIVPYAAATVITTISRDHTEYLGDMIEAIAHEKAGIIKLNAPVIISAQFPDAVKVIEQRAEKMQAPLVRINKEWKIVEIEEEDVKIDSFVYKDEEIFLDILSLHGNHQLENAGAALATFMTLIPEEEFPDPDVIDEALSTIHWPARLERLYAEDCDLPITNNMEIIVDSAHNAEGLFALSEYLKQQNADNPRDTYIILSFKEGRDLAEAFTILSNFPAKYIFVKSHFAHQQCSTDELIEAAEAFSLNYQVADDWKFIVSLFYDKDIEEKRYVVTGSIYFLSVFYKMINYKIEP